MLLNMRMEEKFTDGSIDGFINIPVDKLRANLQKLHNSQPVYMLCRSALLSYIACRILDAHGFDCYNIFRDWWLCSSIFVN